MKSKKRRIVITGANGFIGSNLVRNALDHGWEVTALVHDANDIISIKNPGLSIVKFDISDIMRHCDILENSDAVYHLAAFIPPDFADHMYAEKCFQKNTLGTLNLLEASLQSKVKRFIYFSAGNAYYPSNRLMKETDSLYPSHRAPFYLSSKVTGELFSEYYRMNKNLPVSILRISSPYGKGMPEASMVKMFINRVRDELPIELKDGGQYKADLVYVDDVVQAALLLLEKNVDGIFNVGSGMVLSSLEIAKEVVKVLKPGFDLIKILPSTGKAVCRGFSGLDITKAKNILGYTPTKLKDGLTCF